MHGNISHDQEVHFVLTEISKVGGVVPEGRRKYGKEGNCTDISVVISLTLSILLSSQAPTMNQTSQLTSLSWMTPSPWTGTWLCLMGLSRGSVPRVSTSMLPEMTTLECGYKLMLRIASTAKHATSRTQARTSIGCPLRGVAPPTLGCR